VPSEKKVCECGCGHAAPIATYTNSRRGYKRGEPVRFVHGHHARGSRHPFWNGGRRLSAYGYVLLWMPEHRRADAQGYVLEHVAVAEAALGGPLPPRAVVHHINRNREDNSRGNLVVCQDHAYHMLIHRRERALDACGNPNWRKCKHCGEYADPASAEVYTRPNGREAHHRTCAASARNQRTTATQED
jgi:hypothetical protein